MNDIRLNGYIDFKKIDRTNYPMNKPAKYTWHKCSCCKNEDLPEISYGRDLVTKPTVLNAGEPYLGKSFDVQAIGDTPIDIEEITEDNIEKYQDYIDIWYNGEPTTEESLNQKEGNPRFLHPEIGQTIQHYAPEPIANPYTTQDPVLIDYARNKGLTQYTNDPDIIANAVENGWVDEDTQEIECFENAYTGDRDIIESTYTNEDGVLLKDAGGINGTVKATKCNDMKVALLPVGSVVVPLESQNPKTIGVGDVVCCSVKKGEPQNDWYVKPVSEFLKTAKENDEKGNVELIQALNNFVKYGNNDPEVWSAIVSKFGGNY